MEQNQYLSDLEHKGALSADVFWITSGRDRRHCRKCAATVKTRLIVPLLIQIGNRASRLTRARKQKSPALNLHERVAHFSECGNRFLGNRKHSFKILSIMRGTDARVNR